MSSQCFYCQYPLKEERFHYVAFVSIDEEREETLCKDCYQEWLAGIKE